MLLPDVLLTHMPESPILPPLKSVLKDFDATAARRAIYVDFEGRPWHPPVLLGWRRARALGCLIVDPAFETCAHRRGGRHVCCAALPELLEQWLEPAREPPHIVSWSLHDYRLMMRALSRTGQQALRRRYVNALAIIRPWYWKTYGQTSPVPYTLSNMRREFGLSVPARFGDGVVGVTLAHLQERLASGARYRDLEPEERKGWVAVVRHNRYDLDHMRDILLQVMSVA